MVGSVQVVPRRLGPETFDERVLALALTFKCRLGLVMQDQPVLTRKRGQNWDTQSCDTVSAATCPAMKQADRQAVQRLGPWALPSRTKTQAKPQAVGGAVDDDAGEVPFVHGRELTA